MVEAILKYPSLYRLYQKTIRSRYSEYDFFKFIFQKYQSRSLRVLDLCCGDSYILNFINPFIKDYLGVDISEKYLKFSKNNWQNFNFKKLDLNDKDSLKEIIAFKPNFIFINGAIHHLDDETAININKLINYFENSFFLSVDPVKSNNKLLNKLMIFFDRGRFIRKQENYSKLMQGCNNVIIDDFYKMSFKQIFHFRNLEIEELYSEWKRTI
tara:strand:- start:964 stop:1599 length:636 start_codon:yes stop_codon:yes gene_type:complete